MTRRRTIVGSACVVRTPVVCLFLLLACFYSAASSSDRTIAQFAHTSWGPKDGAPSAVTALAQTPDGYLWVGSDDGLYRFDGVVFGRYQPQSGDLFPTQHVRALLALPNGDLWVGFEPGGLSLVRNTNATTYTARDGLPGGAIRSVGRDGAGTIWAATANGLGRLEGKRWKEVGRDWNFPGKSAWALFLDHQGTLWASTEDTLVFLPPGARRFQTTGIRATNVTRIAQAANGKLWMAETTRSVRPIPISEKQQPPDETEVQVGSEGLLFDNDGALWITSLGDGLRRSPAPELLRGRVREFSTAVESFTAKDGLSDDYVRAILQDREGNVWIGTNSGLDRFRKTNLVTVVLPIKPQQAVMAAGNNGDVWVVDPQAFVFRIHGGRAGPGHPIPTSAIYAYRDPAGAIWWLCLRAIYRYQDGTYTRIALPASIPKSYDLFAVITQDGSGAFWLAARSQGLFYEKKGGWKRLEAASKFARLTPESAFTDWMGRAWFGYEEGTIVVLKDENIQRVFPADGSPVGGVRAINGRGRHTWIGGELGLAFSDGDRFQRILPADAEAFGLVTAIEETADGSLWLTENKAVIQVPASEVREALDNPSYRVKYRAFDSFDGLLGTFAGNTSIQQKEIQATDGRLWFCASGGVVWIDPRNISTNTLPPNVLIRSVKANGRQSISLPNLVLPARTTELQIGYTALSLSSPEKVRFRYRLEGVDKDWEDAGSRREAFYTRLGPGAYHFRVIACNNDGIWNQVGAHLDFNIAPAWYQTKWFRGLCATTVLGLIWMLYWLRVRHLQQKFAMVVDARVNERTRIARELHDTVLQTLQGLLMSFQRVANLLPDRPAEAKQRLEGAIDQAAQAITEGRDAVQGLRSSTALTNELAVAIRTLGQELAAKQTSENSPLFSVAVEGTPCDLNPIVRDDVYRIAGEALRNAFQHAQARRIEVELRYDERGFRLRIRDDGKGVAPDISINTGRSGHWGLQGMRERAKLVGGQLEIWSELNSGTEIELSIPASTAYLSVAPRQSKKRTAINL